MVGLDSCNHTELYQLCRRLNLPAHPAMTRAQLAAVLMGEELSGIPEYSSVVNEATPHPFDPWRHGLAGFVLGHWHVLQNQVSCPLKSKDPRSCFGCLDTQVVSCLVGNPKNEHLIALHRKNG